MKPLTLAALLTFLAGCEAETAKFGAPCNGDRDCGETSYCVAGCGDNAARCVPYGSASDVQRYRPVECCGGSLYYTGQVSDDYKARVKEAVGNPVVRDAAKGFPPALVNAVAADQAQQCLVCDHKMSVAAMAARCEEPPAPLPKKEAEEAAVDAGVASTTTTTTTTPAAATLDAGVVP